MSDPSIAYDKAIELAHRSLQARLDGYRQSSGAFIAAVFAFAAAFDAFIVKVDKADLNSFVGYVLASLILLVCLTVTRVLRSADIHFAEMSGLVVKLEKQIGLFSDGPNQEEPIYPAAWQKGWHDFAIVNYYYMAILILLSQIAVIASTFDFSHHILAAFTSAGTGK